MATIALQANKINNMPGMIKAVTKSVVDYKAELSSLKRKSQTVNRSVCNLDDIVDYVQSSTQTQEEKINSLEAFSRNSEQFIKDTVRIDDDVSDVVKKRKADFYDKYDYLKPECEKTRWEKFKDGCKAVGEWCKEHWKIVVTVVVVIVAAALILTGVGGILAAIAAGALIGAGTGGVLGGIISKITGGSFWEGFENGAFMGAIAGIISGGMQFGFTSGLKGLTLTFKQSLAIGGVSGSGTSLIRDLGDIFIRGDQLSLGQVILNMGIAGVTGTITAGIGYGISKAFAAFRTGNSEIYKSRSFSESPAEVAKSWQGSGKYPGIDNYRDVIIKKGNVIYRGEPNGTEYFTTKSAIERSGRNATKIFEGLQVEKNPIHGYRGTMQGFEVVKNIRAAFGNTKANPQFGKGGLPQLYVLDVDELIEQGILKPVEVIQLIK